MSIEHCTKNSTNLKIETTSNTINIQHLQTKAQSWMFTEFVFSFFGFSGIELEIDAVIITRKLLKWNEIHITTTTVPRRQKTDGAVSCFPLY